MPTTDVFGRERWPALTVEQWLNDYGIPHRAKRVRRHWYDSNATQRDYHFECREDASWFLMNVPQWSHECSSL
jgi:hypothetical protein